MPGLPSRKKNLPASAVRAFQRKIYAFSESEGRSLPWRSKVTPYRVLVSEIMLQQTQVERVVGKYREFLAAFPAMKALAAASTAELLSIWSGMGYNRRALALRALAQKVMSEHGGRLPRDPDALLELPGIGRYTAGAVAAFAYNQPVVFMDTNIRRVFIHEFFPEQSGVHDDELLPLVEQTLDRENPRKWYNALMDYGARLKREQANPNRRSVHYTRQSPFENSNRQVRGRIVQALVRETPLTERQVIDKTGMDPDRVRHNLERLCAEGFIRKTGRNYRI